MADQHMDWSEVEALQSGVAHSAQAWSDLKKWIGQSETKRAFEDEDYFYRQADELAAARIRPLAEKAKEATDRSDALTHVRGMAGSGAAEKSREKISGEFDTARASITAELTAAAGAKTTRNEAAYLDLLDKLSAAGGDVIDAQTRLSSRFGQHAAGDDNFRKLKSLYRPTTSAGRDFWGEMGWG